jgi:hypothetical protein
VGAGSSLPCPALLLHLLPHVQRHTSHNLNTPSQPLQSAGSRIWRAKCCCSCPAQAVHLLLLVPELAPLLLLLLLLLFAADDDAPAPPGTPHDEWHTALCKSPQQKSPLPSPTLSLQTHWHTPATSTHLVGCCNRHLLQPADCSSCSLCCIRCAPAADASAAAVAAVRVPPAAATALHTTMSSCYQQQLCGVQQHTARRPAMPWHSHPIPYPWPPTPATYTITH